MSQSVNGVTPSSLITVQTFNADGTLGAPVQVPLSTIASIVAPAVAFSVPAVASATIKLIASNDGAGLDVSDASVEVSGTTLELAAALENMLPLGGGAMSGTLTLSTMPTGPMDAVPKSYVDNAVASINAISASIAGALQQAATYAGEAEQGASNAAIAASAASSSVSLAGGYAAAASTYADQASSAAALLHASTSPTLA